MLKMKKLMPFCLTCILTFLFFVVTLLFLQEVATYSKQNKFYQNLHCKYISTYEGTLNIEKEYCLLNNIYSIYYNDKKLKVDILMQQNQSTIFNEKKLNIDEVVVSNNFLSNNYFVGDYITVMSPLNGELLHLKIVGTVDDCYGITNESIDDKKSILIFGFNERLLNIGCLKIAFLNNENLSNSNIKLLTFTQVNTLIFNNNKELLPILLLCYFVFTLFVVIYVCIILILYKNKIRRNILSGRSLKNIIFSTYLKYCLPVIFALILSVVAIWIYALIILRFVPHFSLVILGNIVVLFIIIYCNFLIKIKG